MKPLRLLILFFCGYLLAFGLGFLWEGSQTVRQMVVAHKNGVQLPAFPPYTPPRWIRERAAYDAAHPRIRRIVEWRVCDEYWKQVGVVYNGEVFDLDGERRGCL